MKTQRRTWALAILATGLLLGYVGAGLFQFPALQGADRPLTNSNGLPGDIGARLNALEVKLNGIELLVTEQREDLQEVTEKTALLQRVDDRIEVRGGLAVIEPDGTRGIELLVDPGLPALFASDGLRSVELLTRDTDELFRAKADTDAGESMLSFDPSRFIIALLDPGDPEEPLSQLRVDPTECIIAILRQPHELLQNTLKVDWKEVTVATDKLSIDAKAVTAPGASMTLKDLYADTVTADEFIDSSPEGPF